MISTLTRLFPLWALLFSAITYFTPARFTPILPHRTGMPHARHRGWDAERGLAAQWGKTYFSVLAALPGALCSVWHHLSGSLLAGYGRTRPTHDHSARPRMPR